MIFLSVCAAGLDYQKQVVAKVKQATAYPQAPEYDVFINVNAVARGWTNYYRYAHNSNVVAGRLVTVVFWRVAHYLGKKHRQSLRKIMRRHYKTHPRTGCKTLSILNPGAKSGSESRCYLWHKRPKRLSLYVRETQAVQDTKPNLITSWATGHSRSRRLETLAAAAGACQGCGREGVPLVVHHPNRLRNAKRVRKGNGPVAQSGYAQQGKALCQACHLEHHHGHTRQ